MNLIGKQLSKASVEEASIEEASIEEASIEEASVEETNIEETDAEETAVDPFSYKGEMKRDSCYEAGKLNMRSLMESFMRLYDQTYGSLTQAFPAEDGRELFLRFLTPIVDGRGSVTIDEQTRNENRMDVIIDYLGQQYIIELKIWHREWYADMLKQMREYLDHYGLKIGYMLSFDFHDYKVTGVQWKTVGEKTICEGVI
ncbi:MAG: hypothetical protein IKO03_13360 [Lachnospiraceae bacterium]|nr:hypothetical protein [Lachnospiraceae bacterium]